MAGLVPAISGPFRHVSGAAARCRASALPNGDAFKIVQPLKITLPDPAAAQDYSLARVTNGQRDSGDVVPTMHEALRVYPFSRGPHSIRA